jgi:hypothetical protein
LADVVRQPALLPVPAAGGCAGLGVADVGLSGG